MQSEFIIVKLFQHEDTTEHTTVFAELKSVSFDETVRAEQMGYKSKYKLVLNFAEYNDEQVIDIDGKLYCVYRTYKASPDKLEVFVEDRLGIWADHVKP